MNRKCFRAPFVVALTLCVLVGCPAAWADDVTDSISEALSQYKSGDLNGAVGSLTYAAQLIGQKKGGQLQTFLPEPLPGWTAEEASSQAMNAAIMGGGVTAEREYQRPTTSEEDISHTISVKFTADSPMLQGMVMMLNNPMFATSDGGKLEKIKGEKAIVKFNANDKSGNINIVVAGRILVTVEGNGITLDELKEYAKAIDYKKMAQLP